MDYKEVNRFCEKLAGWFESQGINGGDAPIIMGRLSAAIVAGVASDTKGVNSLIDAIVMGMRHDALEIFNSSGHSSIHGLH